MRNVKWFDVTNTQMAVGRSKGWTKNAEKIGGMNTVWRHLLQYNNRATTEGNWKSKLGNPNTRPQEGSTEKKCRNEPKETAQGTQNGTEIKGMG